MGGHKRKGQAQRTKNNMKPSNSGRIAELVDNKSFQFSSFSSLNDSHTAASTSALSSMPVISAEMFSPSVDPNFQVIFKKVNKKDATTRFKALQELKELCKTSTPEILNQVLPVWARIYCILAIDVEHRVREAVQEVHRLIVNSVGRNLAPYLKQIAPLWFISQYDTYAPAASVATNAFQESFSAHKMAEVISYCQTEILGYIRENILNLSPQSISKGDLSKEEMEAKYERIIISSLNGYALYLSKIPPEQIEKHKNTNLEIITSSKFWKFSKYKTPAVRAAWFSLISSLCQNGLFLLENEKKHLANSIIGSTDDNDSTALAAVWEAALQSFSHIPDFWLHVNIEKFFLPKFCNILKHGGHGNATCIYPNILLLLNSIPADIIKEKNQFYDKIFTSFQEGMKVSLVTQSSSASEEIASSFVECIHYLIKINVEDHEFCQFLLDKHLIKIFSTYMNEPIYRYQLKSFLKSLSQMLLSWYKNENSLELYETLLIKIWVDIRLVSVTNFESCISDKDKISLLLCNHFLIISTFNSPQVLKKKLKVSFAEDLKVNESQKQIHSDSVSPTKTNSEKKLEIDALVLAKELFQLYYNFCLKTENKELKILLLSQMNKMINLLNYEIKSLLASLSPKWSSSILMWIKDTDILMEHLLGLIFSTLEFLAFDEQAALMEELTQERCKECLNHALKLASHTKNDKLNQWLQSEETKKEICRTFDEISESTAETAKQFLNLNSNGEFIVGVSTVLALIEKVKIRLCSHDIADLKIGTEMASNFFNNMASVKQFSYENIALRLLECLFINIIKGQGIIVYTTWEQGMKYIASSCIDENFLKEHISKLSSHLTSCLTDRKIQVDIKLIHLSFINLIDILIKNNKQRMCEFGVQFIDNLLSSICFNLRELQRQIDIVCHYGDVINGKSDRGENVLEDEELCAIKGKWDPLHDINVLGYVRSIDFVLKLISSAYGVEIYEEDNEDDADNKLSSLPNFPDDVKESFDSYLVLLTCGLALLQKFKSFYYSTRQYFDVKSYIEPYRKVLKELIQSCDRSQHLRILDDVQSSGEGLSRALKLEAKELILDFLDGTLPDCSRLKVILTTSFAEVPEHVLNINEIYEMRKLIENGCVKSNSQSKLIAELKSVSDKYNATFSNMNSKNLIEVELNYLQITTEMACLYQAVIAAYPTLIDVAAWDFARISVTKWLKSISQTDVPDDNIEFVKMSIATCKLLMTISNTLTIEESLANYCEEWRELFAADAYYFLCKSWKNITEKALERSVNYKSFLHILHLSETISCLCDMESFYKLKPEHGNIKEWFDFTMTCILAPSVPVQITSYKILKVLLPYLTKLDDGLNEASLDKISCNMLEPKLIETETVFMAILQDFIVGVSCSVAPFTDSYTYSLAYLLLWSILIKMCKEGDSQQKYIYPLWIREKDFLAHFIEGVVKLMPEYVIYFQEKSVKKGPDFFVSIPHLTFSDWTSEKMSHLCCWLLTELMATLPAVMRQWASEAEPKLLTFVDRLVTAFISPNLALREMSAINKQHKSFDNMKVYTHPSVREVVAVYTVEESSTELVIQLANNHPLSPPKVDISKAMISSIQTRQWLKQLTIFLTHQNGSIWDGLVLWKSNLDKKFEGIEECYICFSILHNTTHQLPKLSCHTCKKKFHSYCLYKWFSTSHKSTCPICRAIF